MMPTSSVQARRALTAQGGSRTGRRSAAAAFLLGLGAAQRNHQPLRRFSHVGAVEADEPGAPQRGREADQQHGPIPDPA
jgi:hypothetical protein